MEKLNSILREEIKSRIIGSLMRGESSFSELLKITKLRDHGQLNYHLNVLINEGIIERSEGDYKVTELGEKMGVYINQFMMKEMYPLTVVCAVVKDSKGRILLIRRAKNPEKGKWGFPGGKVRIGEKIEEAIKRELYEETGLYGELKKVLGFFSTIVHNKDRLSWHANIIPVLMEVKGEIGKIRLEEDSDMHEFVNLKNVKKYELIPNNKDILEKIAKNKLFIEEKIYVKD